MAEVPEGEAAAGPATEATAEAAAGGNGVAVDAALSVPPTFPDEAVPEEARGGGSVSAVSHATKSSGGGGGGWSPEDDDLDFTEFASVADGLVKPSSKIEAAVLSRLDARIFTADFDPLPQLLRDLPTRAEPTGAKDETGDAGEAKGEEMGEATEVARVEAHMNLADQAAETVQQRLVKQVALHSAGLVEGMRGVRQVDGELRLAALIAGNARRMLKAADERLTGDVLSVTHLEKRRRRLVAVRGLVADVRTLMGCERFIEEAARSGDLVTALARTHDAEAALGGVYNSQSSPSPPSPSSSSIAPTSGVAPPQHLRLGELELMKGLRRRLTSLYPSLRRAADASLWRIIQNGGQGQQPRQEELLESLEKAKAEAGSGIAEEKCKDEPAEEGAVCHVLNLEALAAVVGAYLELDENGVTASMASSRRFEYDYDASEEADEDACLSWGVQPLDRGRVSDRDELRLGLRPRSANPAAASLEARVAASFEGKAWAREVAAGNSARRCLGADGSYPGVSGMATRAHRFFIFQVEKQAMTAAAEALSLRAANALMETDRSSAGLSGSIPLACEATETGLPSRGRGRGRAGGRSGLGVSGSAAPAAVVVSSPRAVVALMHEAADDAAVQCILDTCEVLTNLLQRHWRMAHWLASYPLGTAAAAAAFDAATEAERRAMDAAAASRASVADKKAAAAPWTLSPSSRGLRSTVRGAVESTSVESGSPLSPEPPLSSSDWLTVGARVLVRDGGDGEGWEAGTVEGMGGSEDAKPLVRKDGYDTAYTWDEYRLLLTPEPHGNQTPADADPSSSRCAPPPIVAARGGGGEREGDETGEKAEEDAATFLARERRERQRRERSRVAPVGAVMLAARPKVWLACEAQLLRLLTALPVGGDPAPGGGDNGSEAASSEGGGTPRNRLRTASSGSDMGGGDKDEGLHRLRGGGLRLESMCAVTVAIEAFVLLGRAFLTENESIDRNGQGKRNGDSSTGTDAPSPSNRLLGCLRLKAKQFFQSTHVEQVAAAEVMLENEHWQRLLLDPPPPLPASGLGQGTQQGHEGRATAAATAAGGGGWDPGMCPPWHPASTLHVLTPAAPSVTPPRGYDSDCSGDSGGGRGGGGRAGLLTAAGTWGGGAAFGQHLTVRALVAATLRPVAWSEAASQRPCLANLLQRRQRTLDRLWHVGSDGGGGSSEAVGCLLDAAALAAASGAVVRARDLVGYPGGSTEGYSKVEYDGHRTEDVDNSPVFLFGQRHAVGNPFTCRDCGRRTPPTQGQSKTASDGGGGVARASSDGSGLLPGAEAFAGMWWAGLRGEEGGVARAEGRAFGGPWCVTTAALNSVARSAGRYLQVMALLPVVAAEAQAGLSQIVKLYVYTVLTVFTPPRALRALFPAKPQPGSRRHRQRQRGSTSSAVPGGGGGGESDGDSDGSDHEEIDLGQWSGGGGGGGDVNEEEAEIFTTELPVDGASRRAIRLLVAEVAHERDPNLAAACAAGMAGGGGGGGGQEDGSRPADAAGHSEDSQTAAVSQAATYSADPALTAPKYTGAAPLFGSTHSPVLPPGYLPSPPVPLPGCVVPQRVAGGWSGPQTLWGLRERIVAAQSLNFVVEVLLAIRPQLVGLLAASALAASTAPAAQRALSVTMPGQRLRGKGVAAAVVAREATLGAAGHCEAEAAGLMDACLEAQAVIFRSAARLLVRCGRISQEAAVHPEWSGCDSNTNAARAHESGGGEEEGRGGDFSDRIVEDCERAWTALCIVEGGGGGGGGFGYGGGWVTPFRAREIIWSNAVQAVMETLVSGFAKAPGVSSNGRRGLGVDEAGRALMVSSVAALQLRLDRIHRVRPVRGKVYVEAYLRAFFLGSETELAQWISANWQYYQASHMEALCSGVCKAVKRKHLKPLLRQVRALYDHHQQQPQPQEQEH